MLEGPAINSQLSVAAPTPHSPLYETWMQIAAKHASRPTTPIAAAHMPTQARASQSLASPTSFQGFRHPDDVLTDNGTSQRSVILLSQRPPTVDSVFPSNDNNGSSKGPLPTVPPNGDPTGGPTPDATIGGSFADIPPATGTSDNALSTAIQKTPPGTAIMLDHLDCK
jgi:hypothetical protein